MIVVLVLMVASGVIGLYYGSTVSPISTGLTTIGEIIYDNKAEAEFNAQIGILDAQIEEKDLALSDLEQKNIGLERRVNNWQDSYNSAMVKVEAQQEENQTNFDLVSIDLERSIEGNSKAQDDLVELNNLFISNKNLFQGQLEEANNYITTLEESNAGLIHENTLLRSINDQILQQNQIMRDRIEDISGARARHGPGIAAGIDPINDYSFATVVGWTVSWS